MATEVTFTDNSGKVLDEMTRKKILALAQVGQMAEEFAKKNCPVDTGRLRNSITWATYKHYGKYSYKDNNKKVYSDKSSKPDDNDAVYIGTNVVYAPYQEFGDSFKHTTGQAHFLRDAATTHGDEYKKEVDKIMKA